MYNKNDVLAIINKSKVILGDRNYNRLLELMDIEPNWDGQNADSINFESVVSMLEFLKTKNVIANDLCIFFDYEGYVILDWNLKEIRNELTFKNNSILYWNSNLDDSIAILEYHLKYVNFDAELDVFGKEEINKLSLIANIDNALTKRTIDSLINVAISSDYECRYSPSYKVDNYTFENTIKFLDKISLPDINLWVVASRDIEAQFKNDKYDIEIDFSKNSISIYNTPFSDENILDITMEDVKKFKNIEEMLELLK